MDSSQKGSTALFDVYLRLRPPTAQPSEPFLEIDHDVASDGSATHVTIKPPADDHRKRAVERFAFTKVFSEDASQLDIFNGTTILPLVESVLAPQHRQGRDGLLATLGVTGSGKSHTILGSKTQRGLTQLTLDVLFKSIGDRLAAPTTAFQQLAAVDVSEAQLMPAASFLESIYGDSGESRVNSRAQTPLTVSKPTPLPLPSNSPFRRPPPRALYEALLRLNAARSKVGTAAAATSDDDSATTIRPVTGMARITRSVAKLPGTLFKEPNSARAIYSPAPPTAAKRPQAPSLATLPQSPSVSDIHVAADRDAEYALAVSMYEVYNDRIFDLLACTFTTGSRRGNGNYNPARDVRRRPLLFKSTEYSPDRKVVAGLRKIVCGSLEEALLILETGLTERRVAGTGSNATSSRSHGFFCVEVKKKRTSGGSWTSSTLTIVDLAGSERARTAKTTGSTLAEAGKINESLMYLGQCMQMQSSSASDEGRNLVPIRHCKLTELLFANSLPHGPSAAAAAHTNTPITRQQQQQQQQQQRAIMIVTADPRGDFNATSQILRYSALAREVTVPRIPSVSSTIMSGTTAVSGAGQPSHSQPSSRPQTSHGDGAAEEQLAREVAVLRLQLDEEARRRADAETLWARAEERAAEVEAEVREECWGVFEGMLRKERARWAEAREEERERGEGFLDSKVELLMKGVGFGIHEDADGEDNRGDPGDRAEELERDNERLRRRVEELERDRAGRTPSRKVKVLRARKWNVDDDQGQENAVVLD